MFCCLLSKLKSLFIYTLIEKKNSLIVLQHALKRVSFLFYVRMDVCTALALFFWRGCH